MSARDSSRLESSDSEVFSFTLPGRLEYRDAAKAFLAYVCDRLARRQQMPEDTSHRVISAFVEAFNNAVLHSDQPEAPPPVDVELRVSDDRLILKVVDHGSGFEPDEVPEPDLESLPEGGMGLFIMKSFMDSVEYERQEGRNVLTMSKELAGPAAEPRSEGDK